MDINIPTQLNVFWLQRHYNVANPLYSLLSQSRTLNVTNDSERAYAVLGMASDIDLNSLKLDYNKSEGRVQGGRPKSDSYESLRHEAGYSE